MYWILPFGFHGTSRLDTTISLKWDEQTMLPLLDILDELLE